LLSVGWGIVLATTVYAANRMTEGAFVLNVFRSTATLDLERQPLYVLAALVAGAGVFAGGSLAYLLPGASQRLFKRYFVLALLLAVVSMGKAGANVNYFLEPFAVGCLLVSFLLQRSGLLLAAPKTALAFMVWLGFLFGPTLGVMLGRVSRFPANLHQMAGHHATRVAQASVWRDVLSRINGVREPMLIENPYLALRRGLPPYLLNPANFSGMQVGGTFDDSTLLRLIETGGIGVIVSDFPLTDTAKRRAFPERWLSEMQNHYLLAEVVSGFYIYRPGQS
jgi:hypothetical protein